MVYLLVIGAVCFILLAYFIHVCFWRFLGELAGWIGLVADIIRLNSSITLYR